MKIIHDAVSILSANTNSSTANSTSVRIDKTDMISVSATITDSTPSAKTFLDANVTVGTENIAVTAHGFLTGLLVRLTSSGTLPAGLSLATDYFVIRVDADNIKLASSLANALAGTAVNITAAAGGGTHTITATAALAGSLIVQGSNDDVTYVTPTGSQYNQSYTAAGSFLFNLPDLAFKHVRLRDSVTSGQSTVTATLTSKGDSYNP